MSIKTWLENLASTNKSEDKDSITMENLLRILGFPEARVVCGIVYLMGHGTLEAPPQSIHVVARMLLNVVEVPQ